MKKIKIFLVLLISVGLFSCATVKESIPVTEKPILSQDEIVALEVNEEKLAREKYEALVAATNDIPGQPLISNVFVQMDVRAVLIDIMNQTGINIIADNTVNGQISLVLEDVPLETALKMILYPGGYEYRYVKDKNYYLVGKSLPENSSFNDLAITKVIKTNGSADEVLSQLSTHYQAFAKSSGQTITITASPDIVNRMEQDISIIDKAKRQIEITAQFVMIEWNKGSNLGVQWGDVDFSAIGLADIVKNGANTLTANLTSGLSSFLSAKGFDTSIKTIAEPRIIVQEGEEAELNVTEEHLFLILSGGGAAYNYFTTKDVETGIKLKVQSFITRDGQIRMVANPEVSDIIGEREFKSNGGPSQKLPIIARRSTQTTVQVVNGETFVIGGLITKTEKDNRSGVPFFRKIPLIGFAFGGKEKSSKEVELVIFLTPKVIG
jgi:type II secretory pathway component HofQ